MKDSLRQNWDFDTFRSVINKCVYFVTRKDQEKEKENAPAVWNTHLHFPPAPGVFRVHPRLSGRAQEDHGAGTYPNEVDPKR